MSCAATIGLEARRRPVCLTDNDFLRKATVEDKWVTRTMRESKGGSPQHVGLLHANINQVTWAATSKSAFFIAGNWVVVLNIMTS